jgi:hypothetical protein
MVEVLGWILIALAAAFPGLAVRDVADWLRNRREPWQSAQQLTKLVYCAIIMGIAAAGLLHLLASAAVYALLFAAVVLWLTVHPRVAERARRETIGPV